MVLINAPRLPLNSSQTILPSTFFISSSEKARSVSERTLPRDETLSTSAVAVSSSGASNTTTVSWLPSVQYISHILLGIDHLLFVLALVLLVKGWKRLVGTITAFTVAHSITLAAATLGFVHVPGPPVEACIALSIVFVAAEIIRGRQGKPGLTERAESNLTPFQPLNRLDQLLQGAREAVEPSDDDRVALAGVANSGGQLGPVAKGARGLFD